MLQEIKEVQEDNSGNFIAEAQEVRLGRGIDEWPDPQAQP